MPEKAAYIGVCLVYIVMLKHLLQMLSGVLLALVLVAAVGGAIGYVVAAIIATIEQWQRDRAGRP